MKPSNFQRTIQCQFDCKLKRVVKGIVRNYRKELKRRRNKEISYCELPEIVVESWLSGTNMKAIIPPLMYAVLRFVSLMMI